MHEMAVAGFVLDGALRHAAGRRVTHVQLRVGHLRQVVPGALEFNWSLVTTGTAAEGATLGVEEVGVVGRCRGCGVESGQSGFPFRCEGCGDFDLETVRGDELLIDWLEVERDEDGSADVGSAKDSSSRGGGR